MWPTFGDVARTIRRPVLHVGGCQARAPGVNGPLSRSRLQCRHGDWPDDPDIASPQTSDGVTRSIDCANRLRRCVGAAPSRKLQPKAPNGGCIDTGDFNQQLGQSLGTKRFEIFCAKYPLGAHRVSPPLRATKRPLQMVEGFRPDRLQQQNNPWQLGRLCAHQCYWEDDSPPVPPPPPPPPPPPAPPLDELDARGGLTLSAKYRSTAATSVGPSAGLSG